MLAVPCALRGCLCHSFINTHFLEQSFSCTHECLKFAFLYIWGFPPIFHQNASIFSWVHPMTLCSVFRTNFLSGAAEETSRKSLHSKMLEKLWLLKAHAPLNRRHVIYHLSITKENLHSALNSENKRPKQLSMKRNHLNSVSASEAIQRVMPYSYHPRQKGNIKNEQWIHKVEMRSYLNKTSIFTAKIWMRCVLAGGRSPGSRTFLVTKHTICTCCWLNCSHIQ